MPRRYDKPDARESAKESAKETAKDAIKETAKASPEILLTEIAQTRAHMDENLDRLKLKIKPRFRPEFLQIPAAAAFLGMMGFLIYRAVRPKPKAGPADRIKIKTANWIDGFKIAKTLAVGGTKGAPRIYIIQPRR